MYTPPNFSYVRRTCDALEQSGHGEDTLAEDGLDTDADQRTEVRERHQHSAGRHQYQRRLPRVRKRVVRHIKPAHEGRTLAAGVPAGHRTQDVREFRSAPPRALVEDADGDDGGAVVGPVGDRREVRGSTDGRGTYPVVVVVVVVVVLLLLLLLLK